MLRRVARLLERSLTTETAATEQVTNKRVRRSLAASQVTRRDRFRRRAVTRGRDLYAKEMHVKASMAAASDGRDVIMAQLADQIFSKGHAHVATATNVSFVPDGNPATPLVALAGRGQVGKTSLLRSLFRSPTQVGKSNRTLRRDAMNFFSVGDVFQIVDLPGFGGTSVPWSTVLQHAVLLRNFVRFQPSLKMLYYCIDVHYRNGLYVQDMDMLKFLTREVPNFTVVLTKADKISESDRSPSTLRVSDVRKELAFNDIHHPVIVTSAYRMGGIDTLRFDMVMNALHALPTERLTLTEAKRLSMRLFSLTELGTVRHLPMVPTQLNDALAEWKVDLAAEAAEEGKNSPALPSASDGNAGAAEGGESTSEADEAAVAAAAGAPGADAHSDAERTPSPADEFHIPADELACAVDEQVAAADALVAAKAATTSGPPSTPIAFPSDPARQAAYTNLLRKAENASLLQYVERTSPWRNPFKWPTHVVPTKHPRSNVMRCPGDPTNPYLTQPQFVTPRADMCFRRPNVGVRKSSQKGRYEPDRPLQYLLKAYTVPYFPDIVDTAMHPEPWTFLGSREAYYEKGGGRLLGVRLSNHAREGEVEALSDNPAPENTELTREVRRLEGKRYGAPIAMLRPPSAQISVPDDDGTPGKVLGARERDARRKDGQAES